MPHVARKDENARDHSLASGIRARLREKVPKALVQNQNAEQSQAKPRLTAETSRVLLKGRDEVKAVDVHHLVPGPNEVLDKLPVRIRTSVDLRQRPELGIRTEDEIGSRCRPPDFARLAISSFKRIVRI